MFVQESIANTIDAISRDYGAKATFYVCSASEGARALGRSSKNMKMLKNDFLMINNLFLISALSGGKLKQKKTIMVVVFSSQRP